MEKKKAKDIFPTPLRLVTVGLMMFFMAALCRTNGTEFPSETEIVATEVVRVLGSAQVRRELNDVWVGIASENELPKLDDGDWHDLLLQEIVVTNENGEGWVDIDIDDRECLRIYVFQSSKLTKAACPKSAYQGGNVVCNLEGTDAFNNTCASQVIIQTLSAEIQLEGTWLSVSYLPDLELSLLMVLEGQARVQPVTDIQSRELGDDILVTGDQFLFTMPDDNLADIGSLEPRQSHPIESLPPVIDSLGFREWIYRIRDKSEADMGIQLPVPPEILDVDYPEDIPSEITENNPLPWDLHFRDLDGDVYQVVGEVVEAEVIRGSIDSFDFRVNASDIIEGDKKEGVVRFGTWCNGAVGTAKFQMTLIDEAGYHSLPVEFVQRCVPGTPTPTVTSTPTPTPTSTYTPTPTQTNTPTPTSTPTPEVLVDLVEGARSASWFSSEGRLPFPGEETDARGFALWRNNYRMEDGSVPLLSLETHPSWVSNGYIEGYYPLDDRNIVIRSGDRIAVRVGFLNGAEGGDVTFKIWVNYGTYAGGCGEFGCTQELLSLFDRYDGRMLEGEFPLPERLVGQNINSLSLRVEAGESSARDWATWMIARLERPWAGFFIPRLLPTLEPILPFIDGG